MHPEGLFRVSTLSPYGICAMLLQKRMREELRGNMTIAEIELWQR